MKRVLAIVLCIMMVGSLFAMAISAAAEEVEDSAVVGAVAATDELGEPIPDGNGTTPEDIDTDETTAPDEDATVVETTDETTAETTAETTIETTTETTTSTEATEPATKDQPKPDKKPSPKTGENMWLWIGIGIFGVALIVIIITFVVKKKAK